MQQDFGRTLSLLRKERHISQRQASEELGISQALLSHYENGIREPGLQFVVRACDYYQVSADYLLGRTLDREGALLAAPGRSGRGGGRGRGKLAAESKKRLIGALSLLLDLLDRLESTALLQAAVSYLSASVYQLIGALSRVSPGEALPGELPEALFIAGAAELELQHCRYRYLTELDRCSSRRSPLPELSEASLLREYPTTAPYLLELTQETGRRTVDRTAEPGGRRRRDA